MFRAITPPTLVSSQCTRCGETLHDVSPSALHAAERSHVLYCRANKQTYRQVYGCRAEFTKDNPCPYHSDPEQLI